MGFVFSFSVKKNKQLFLNYYKQQQKRPPQNTEENTT